MNQDRGVVTATLIDDYHQMRCRLQHDGTTIIGIAGAVDRMPFTTCSDAPSALLEFVGMPLAAVRNELYGSGRASRNCTHLLDLLALSLRHALLDEAQREIEIVLPDDPGGGVWAELSVNGDCLLRWRIENEIITDPVAFTGRGLFGGFAQWVSATFDNDAEIEAALLIQKAAFVARGRKYILQSKNARPRNAPERLGACFTYAEPRFRLAEVSEDYVRDFSGGLPPS